MKTGIKKGAMQVIEGGKSDKDVSVVEQEVQNGNNNLNFTITITVKGSEVRFPIVKKDGGIVTRRVVLEALSKVTEYYKTFYVDEAFNSVA